MAYYKHEDGGTSTAEDIHSTHDQTESSGPSSSVAGALNNARHVDVDGEDNPIPWTLLSDSSTDFKIPPGGCTIAFWAKSSHLTGTGSLECRAGNGGAFTLGQFTGTSPSCLYVSGPLTSSVVLSDDTWFFMAAWVVPGTELGIYVNGTSDTQADAHSADATAARFETYGQKEGAIDEVGFWNRKLSLDELDMLYNSGTPPGYDSF